MRTTMPESVSDEKAFSRIGQYVHQARRTGGQRRCNASLGGTLSGLRRTSSNTPHDGGAFCALAGDWGGERRPGHRPAARDGDEDRALSSGRCGSVDLRELRTAITQMARYKQVTCPEVEEDGPGSMRPDGDLAGRSKSTTATCYRAMAETGYMFKTIHPQGCCYAEIKPPHESSLRNEDSGANSPEQGRAVTAASAS